jgi:CDP-glucose 4,6-dehydratase
MAKWQSAVESVGMNPEFWRDKRVFLTGHTGFKGSWLSLWLHHLNAKVTGFALPPPTQPALFEKARVAETMHSVIGDIRDLDALKRALRESGADIVIHMAAQPLVRLSYDEPLLTYETNVMGTANLLEAVRTCPSVRAVVVVTTDKCYENREWVWGYREDEALGGYDPYSSSKACAEIVTASYRRSYFNPEKYDLHRCAIATARAGNVIGGGDWAMDRLLPDILKAFANRQMVMIRNPHAIRPWQHVLEPLSAYLLLAQRMYSEGCELAGAWNFGPREVDAQSVQMVVQQLASLWGSEASWKITPGEHPHEAHYLKLDVSKAAAQLGWVPRLPLKDALAWTVAWAHGDLAGKDARALCLDQIVRFDSLST